VKGLLLSRVTPTRRLEAGQGRPSGLPGRHRSRWTTSRHWTPAGRDGQRCIAHRHYRRSETLPARPRSHWPALNCMLSCLSVSAQGAPRRNWAIGLASFSSSARRYPRPGRPLRELKGRWTTTKHSLDAPLVFAGMKAFGRSPSGLVKPAVDYLCDRATVVVTNVKVQSSVSTWPALPLRRSCSDSAIWWYRDWDQHHELRRRSTGRRDLG